MNRNRLVMFGAIGFVVLAAVTYPLWRPYFFDDVIDEAFPELSSDLRDAFDKMPEDLRNDFIKMEKENPEEALDTLTSQLGEHRVIPEDEQAMPENMPDEPVILKTGDFIEIDLIHGAVGSAKIYSLPDRGHILRFEDFRSTNGPDLHVLLSSADDPRSRSALGDDYVDLGELKGNIGNQNYEIPEDVDLSQYNSVVIYCMPFHVVFSVATLDTP